MAKLLIVYRLKSPFGGKHTLTTYKREDNTVGFSYYGGWQGSGMAHSISNLQLKRSLPIGLRPFKTVEDLDKEIKSVLNTGVDSIVSSEILNDI